MCVGGGYMSVCVYVCARAYVCECVWGRVGDGGGDVCVNKISSRKDAPFLMQFSIFLSFL